MVVAKYAAKDGVDRGVAMTWLRGHFFDLEVDKTLEYLDSSFYCYWVNIKQDDQLIELYGAGGDCSPEEWMRENDNQATYDLHRRIWLS